jgi:uncharacterized protein (TIGR02466 family)
MFESLDVHNLFPTPLWVIDLKPEIHRRLNARIKTDLEVLISPRPAVARGATLQTDTDIHTYPQFAELAGLIRSGAKEVLEFLKVEYEDFEITGCWANINPPGAVNTPHAHPNNYLGGVYYVQTDEGAEEIVFSDPRPQASVISPPLTEETIYTGNEVAFEAKDGRLVLFPSWLTHGVPVNRSNRDRISIAFNIMFTSYTETMSKTKWKGSVGTSNRVARPRSENT